METAFVKLIRSKPASGILRCRRAIWRTAPMALSLAMGVAAPAVFGQQNSGAEPRPAEAEQKLVARYFLQDEALQMPGYSSGSFLGIGVVDVTQDLAELMKIGAARGVAITAVTQGSPADKAGMRMKDVVVSYNGTALEGRMQLTRMVGETPAGRSVRLEILRDGQPMTLYLTTANRRAVPAVTAVSVPQPVTSPRMVLTTPDVSKIVSVHSSASLGVETEALTSQLATYFGVKTGVLVREVQESSPAEKAGIRAGDVIIYLGERSVTKPADLSRILRERDNPAGRLKLGVVRHQQEITLDIMPLDAATAAPQFEGGKSYPRTPRGIPISSTKH